MNFQIAISVECISIHLYSVVSFPHRSFELPKGIQTPQTRCPRADFTQQNTITIFVKSDFEHKVSKVKRQSFQSLYVVEVKVRSSSKVMSKRNMNQGSKQQCLNELPKTKKLDELLYSNFKFDQTQARLFMFRQTATR